jgi:hypothetical protein
MSATHIAATARTLAFAVAILGAVVGSPAARAQTQTAVEYYYAGWNFYFVTSFPDEIAALDGGAFGGAWKRTGQTFTVWTQPAGGALPTCRFFSTNFSPKSSHFYTPYASECAGLKQNAGWQYEAVAFYLQLPDANGQCAPGSVILFRLYNDGMGGAPNHRFTTDVATFNQMRAAGWIFEGDGRTGALACVPASAPTASPAEGFWVGSTSRLEDFYGIVLDDGSFYFFYINSAISDVGVVSGAGTAAGGQFGASGAVDMNFTGRGVANATVSGTYVPRSLLNGTIASGPSSTQFTTIYDASYEQSMSLGAAAGSYVGVAATATAGVRSASFVLGTTGAFTGATTSCSFAGTLTPHGSVNVFDFSVTFQGGGCRFGTDTLVGIAITDSGELLGFAPNAARTDGFLLDGSK